MTISPHRCVGMRLLIAAAALSLLALVRPVCALAQAPFWGVSAEVSPTNLPPSGEGEIVAVASDLGDGPASGASSTVTLTDKLPEGLKATAISGTVNNRVVGVQCPTGVPAPPLSCTFSGTVNPYERLIVTIKVKVEAPPGTTTSLPNEVSVRGGGAPGASAVQRVRVDGEATPFGVQGFEMSPSNEDGTPARQGGAHPFQLTSTFALNQTSKLGGASHPVALPKDLSFSLPPGLVGDPNVGAQCSEADFVAYVLEANLCPPTSVVGVATVTAWEPLLNTFTKTVPVFNLVPARGEPARFGLEVLGSVPIVIDTSVRSGRDYGVVASVRNTTQTAGLLSAQVTLWGVPGDPRHDNARGWECVAGGAFKNQIKKECPASPGLPREPFLTMPTSCAANPAAEPLGFSMQADSWTNPGSVLSAEYAWLSQAGEGIGTERCSLLPFSPEISVAGEQHAASTPTGLSVEVKVPQSTTLEAEGLAEADVRDTTVTLPEGVELNPAAANGLQACSESAVGFTGLNQQTQTEEFTPDQAACPEASKVGLVRIKTPLLSHELQGSVYLAEPAPGGEAGKNPFNSLIALYIVAEDPVSGVRVKLAGEGQLNEANQQISTTFKNTPQVPFEDLKLELFGGPKASVSTPAYCGEYPSAAAFTPWSGTPTLNEASPGEEFAVTTGAGGSACTSAQPFSPGFDAQSSTTTAGAFTSFALELSRPDGQQAISGLSMHLPSGDAAMLSNVSLCEEPQASQGSCPVSSEVGQAVESAGLGPEPFVENGGRVYVTGPYDGAPFGLSIVTPAVAGPFNLGVVVVRSRIFVDRRDASITIVSDALPTQLKGIPLQLKRIQVLVDRPNFEFNPTNCNPLRIDATIAGSGGALATAASPFQVGGCQNLPFHPGFSSNTQAHTSKADGASLSVKVSSSQGQANIGKAAVILPKVLPSRLSTIQKACVDRVFEANPASCPEGSLVGFATVHTPVLRSALTGPAYLVSHGGAAFPDLEFVLQGEGITLVLDGQTAIRKGVTSSTFNSLPDAPVTSFETVLPEGPHSALTSIANLCTTTLVMPTTLTGQNGALLRQNTRIGVQGCHRTLRRSLSRAQKLARALKACRHKYKHAPKKRIACEKHARRLYGVRNARRGSRTISPRKRA